MAGSVLIVDDSHMMRQILSGFVERQGFKIAGTAGDGVEALELCAARQPDVVTLDIGMPHTDGLAALKTLRESAADCKVIIISAIHDQAVMVNALENGASDFLAKPVSEEQLAEALRRVQAQPARGAVHE